MKIHTHITQQLADTKTPVGLYLALRDHYQFPLLLESSDYNSKDGHYSYICLNPLAGILLHHQVLKTTISETTLTEEITYDNSTLINKLIAFKNTFFYAIKN